MKGHYDLTWKKHANAKKDFKEEEFGLEILENKMKISLPKDLKNFLYRNSMGEYPNWGNYNLYDKNGEVAIGLYGPISTYLNIDSVIRTQTIAREDLGEIYYWHLPINICGQSRIAFDYTHCKENPPVVWVDEEIGPYEDALGSKHWKRYIAPTFKDFIEMIGDQNKPVGDWIDQNLMANGTIVSDEGAEKMPRQ